MNCHTIFNLTKKILMIVGFLRGWRTSTPTIRQEVNNEHCSFRVFQWRFLYSQYYICNLDTQILKWPDHSLDDGYLRILVFNRWRFGLYKPHQDEFTLYTYTIWVCLLESNRHVSLAHISLRPGNREGQTNIHKVKPLLKLSRNQRRTCIKAVLYFPKEDLTSVTIRL